VATRANLFLLEAYVARVLGASRYRELVEAFLAQGFR